MEHVGLIFLVPDNDVLLGVDDDGVVTGNSLGIPVVLYFYLENVPSFVTAFDCSEPVWLYLRLVMILLDELAILEDVDIDHGVRIFSIGVADKGNHVQVVRLNRYVDCPTCFRHNEFKGLLFASSVAEVEQLVITIHIEPGRLIPFISFIPGLCKPIKASSKVFTINKKDSCLSILVLIKWIDSKWHLI